MSFVSKQFKALTIAAALAVAGSAQAAVTTTAPVSVAAGSSFVDQLIGTITLGGLSNVTGALGFVESGTLTFNGFNFPVTFSTVTFSGGSIGTQSFSGASFNFSNLAAGTYDIKASGSVAPGFGGLIAASYEVTPAVPEPETYAMFLAGLGIMGAVARRRSKAA